MTYDTDRRLYERIAELESALRGFVESSPTMIGDRDCGDSACIGCGAFKDEKFERVIEHAEGCRWVAAVRLLGLENALTVASEEKE